VLVLVLVLVLEKVLVLCQSSKGGTHAVRFRFNYI